MCCIFYFIFLSILFMSFFLSGLTEILYCNREMPSSYEGKWGKISYTLQARLTLSIWRVQKTKTEFPFVTKSEFPFASKSEMIIIGLQVAEVILTRQVTFFFLFEVLQCVYVCVFWCRRNNLLPRHHSLALQRSQSVLLQKKWA